MNTLYIEGTKLRKQQLTDHLDVEKMIFSSSIATIEEEACKDCTKLKEVEFSVIKELPDGCFEGCTSLQNMVLPDGLESIGSGVFYECSALSSIYIPVTVEEMGLSVFFGCISLQQVSMSSKLLSSMDINIDHTQNIEYIFIDGIRKGIFTLSLDETTLLYVHDTNVEVVELEPTITLVSQDAFIHTEKLKEIIVSVNTVIEELYFDVDRTIKITRI